ncbi:type II toxin-antitoxin system Phd/YefM family antitoxin [Pantoea sp. FN0302]|uniref:type II toxin-antitoxin system Phd/YefM family antitoxin n=1 Tax=unclassified Pantoea TaxID=2630326 RepID=UPI003CFBA550
MTITTIISHTFNQEASKAKKFSQNGPVYITDRGKIAYVLLNREEFKKLSGSRRSILDDLQMPEAAVIDF